MENLNDEFLNLSNNWVDTEECNMEYYNYFLKKSQEIAFLNNHYFSVKDFAYGELAFRYMWLLILNQVKQNSNLLEIGVYKGSTLSLMRIISDFLNKSFNVYGLTPLNSTGDKFSNYFDHNYLYEIKRVHSFFNINFDESSLIVGLSTDEQSKNQASIRNYDLVYVDGGHDYDTVLNDIELSDKILNVGGFLILDDASSKLNFPSNFPGFRGHSDVADAIEGNKILENYQHLFACGHNRCWKKIK